MLDTESIGSNAVYSYLNLFKLWLYWNKFIPIAGANLLKLKADKLPVALYNIGDVISLNHDVFLWYLKNPIKYSLFAF